MRGIVHAPVRRAVGSMMVAVVAAASLLSSAAAAPQWRWPDATRIVAFEDFAASHPGGKVLSRETGYMRQYGRNPYRGYDAIDNSPFLYSDPTDPRLPAMERVLAVTLRDRHRLYPF